MDGFCTQRVTFDESSASGIFPSVEGVRKERWWELDPSSARSFDKKSYSKKNPLVGSNEGSTSESFNKYVRNANQKDGSPGVEDWVSKFSGGLELFDHPDVRSSPPCDAVLSDSTSASCLTLQSGAGDVDSESARKKGIRKFGRSIVPERKQRRFSGYPTYLCERCAGLHWMESRPCLENGNGKAVRNTDAILCDLGYAERQLDELDRLFVASACERCGAVASSSVKIGLRCDICG